MTAPILNQPWEDVADDVTSAIEKAVQPLLKKAVDDIYGGLLDATQGYLRDNVAFNIASRIDCAERQALSDRQALSREEEKSSALIVALESMIGLLGAVSPLEPENYATGDWHSVLHARAILSLAKGESA